MAFKKLFSPAVAAAGAVSHFSWILSKTAGISMKLTTPRRFASQCKMKRVSETWECLRGFETVAETSR